MKTITHEIFIRTTVNLMFYAAADVLDLFIILETTVIKQGVHVGKFFFFPTDKTSKERLDLFTLYTKIYKRGRRVMWRGERFKGRLIINSYLVTEDIIIIIVVIKRQ